MKVDLTDQEIHLLGLACDEEVLYYGRCLMREGVVGEDGDISWQPGRKLGKNAPNEAAAEMERAMQKAVNENIAIYSKLSDQLAADNTDFTVEQIKFIKDMIHDMPLQFDKHIVVKRQIDETVSFKYVNKFMEIGLESAKKLYLEEFSAIENKLDGAH